tara:strand:- start:800 stop:1336 length:537 start_codon:yes stop_codon:yes gene_type:complete
VKNLDRYTNEGRKFIAEEKETARLVERHLQSKNGGASFKLDLAALGDAENFDAYIYKEGEKIGVCEIKSRDYFNRKKGTRFTWDLFEKFGYLITAAKIDTIREECLLNGINGYIFVNLLNERKIVCIHVCDAKGELLIDYKIRKTKTKYSCNNSKGDTYRDNAFIPIKGNCQVKTFKY